MRKLTATINGKVSTRTTGRNYTHVVYNPETGAVVSWHESKSLADAKAARETQVSVKFSRALPGREYEPITYGVALVDTD